MRENKGITLIALVITIVVLIILAGVVINLSLGENGFFNKAKEAREEYNLAQVKERLEVEILEVQTNIMEEQSREATIDDLLNLIDTTKYEMESNKIKEISSGIVFTIDSKLAIIDVDLIDENESQKINKFEVSIENVNGTYLTINASSATTNDGSVIALYQYYINGNKVKESTENTYTVTELELDTEYIIKVVAIDEDGKEKSSTIIQKTLDKEYLIKDGKDLINMTTINMNSRTENEGYITLTTINTTSRVAFYTNDTIDFSEYSKLNVDMELISKTSSSNGTHLYLGIFFDNTEETFDNSLLIADNAISTADRKTYTKNIEDMNDNYIIAIVKNATTSATQVKYNVYNLWLEK